MQARIVVVFFFFFLLPTISTHFAFWQIVAFLLQETDILHIHLRAGNRNGEIPSVQSADGAFAILESKREFAGGGFGGWQRRHVRHPKSKFGPNGTLAVRARCFGRVGALPFFLPGQVGTGLVFGGQRWGSAVLGSGLERVRGGARPAEELIFARSAPPIRRRARRCRGGGRRRWRIFAVAGGDRHGRLVAAGRSRSAIRDRQGGKDQLDGIGQRSADIVRGGHFQRHHSIYDPNVAIMRNDATLRSPYDVAVLYYYRSDGSVFEE